MLEPSLSLALSNQALPLRAQLFKRGKMKEGESLVSSPDPTLCEGKGLVTVERFLGFCKLSSRVFA